MRSVGWHRRASALFKAMILGLIGFQAAIGAATPWDKIVPNTSIDLPDRPKWLSYATADRFPTVRFNQPVQIVFPPEEDNARMFVVEKIGRVVVISNRDKPEPTTFLNLGIKVYNYSESGLLSLAFHPNYKDNGRLFIYYVAQEWNGTGWDYFNRLSELSVDPEDPNSALPDSEKIIINQPDKHYDHNGGGMLFGPDGYLYLSIGDEGEFYDILGNGQKLDKNLFAGMIRIDVDKRQGNPLPNPHVASSDHYAIPSDNPYLNLREFQGIELEPDKVRTEFYAIGMRNPWRFSFDPLTGKLYSGDTGDHTREEINEIVLGGNYGWPKREGSLPGPQRHAVHDADHGFVDPVAEYGREDGNDIAGMLVYRGTQFPELDGSILFSDYFGGWLGRAVVAEGQSPEIEWLAWDGHIADIALDPIDGHVLMADMSEGRIKFLTPPPSTNLSDLPPTLADTGAFLDVKNFILHPSWIPYEINVPFWSDHAIKSRWISLPGSSRAMRFKENEAWAFPGGTIFMKHFDLEIRRGDPATKKRLETRFLIYTVLGSYYGVTYRWNEAQDNAILVPPEGLKETISIEEDGVDRLQEWNFPSARDCLACHNGGPDFKAAGRFGRYALGFNTAQLNREANFEGEVFNQLHAMDQAGRLNPPLNKSIHQLPRLAAADDEEASLTYRVRSYLASNCEACHESVSSRSRLHWNATFEVTTPETKIVHEKPYNHMGIPDGRLIHRFDPSKSILLERIRRNGLERMPPLGSTEIDEQAVNLIQRWITEDLSKPQSFTDWVRVYFRAVTDPDSIATLDSDGDNVSNFLEFLTQSDPTDPDDFYKMRIDRHENMVQIHVPTISNTYAEIQWTATPGDHQSWKTLEVPENTHFYPASSTLRTIDVSKINLGSAFFRVRLREL